jgi:hypothetical protein
MGRICITEATHKRTKEDEKKRWDGMVEEIKEEQNQMLSEIADIEKEAEKTFWEKLLEFWEKHKGKFELIVIIAIIIVDREWINQPDWYNKALFYGSLVYAVLTSRGLGEALDKLSNFISKKKEVVTILEAAKSAVDVGEDAALKAAAKFEEILANDPAEKRQELIEAIKPLVNATVGSRDALEIVCEKLTEMDTT